MTAGATASGLLLSGWVVSGCLATGWGASGRATSGWATSGWAMSGSVVSGLGVGIGTAAGAPGSLPASCDRSGRGCFSWWDFSWLNRSRAASGLLTPLFCACAAGSAGASGSTDGRVCGTGRSAGDLVVSGAGCCACRDAGRCFGRGLALCWRTALGVSGSSTRCVSGPLCQRLCLASAGLMIRAATAMIKTIWNVREIDASPMNHNGSGARRLPALHHNA
jgi:hypothetical protein